MTFDKRYGLRVQDEEISVNYPDAVKVLSVLESLDLGREEGGLESTGFVYIGNPPDSEDDFDVEDENGQREFTTVKLIREDIEDLL